MLLLRYQRRERMKVASGDIVERLIQGLSAGPAHSAQKSAVGPEGFSQLLEEVVQKASEGSDTKIDTDKIAVMLELIKMQMSQSVMNSFAGNDGEDEGDSFHFMSGLTDIQGTQQQESKVRQSEPSARSIQPPADMGTIIDKASATYGVDKGLISSVIQAESDFNVNATSPKGAMGLMQLMPDTARGLGVSNAYDPEQNVMAGTRYLKSLLNRYNGDVKLALAAYNWGMGNLERSTGKLPEETRNYIARIMKNYDRA
jgi:membrane-bound lytic murein transglycosylase B